MSKLANFLQRLPKDAPPHLAVDVTTAFGVIDNFSRKVAEIKSNGDLSTEGHRKEIRKLYDGSFSAHMQQLLTKNAENLAKLRETRAGYTVPAPEPGDLAGELRRGEIRAWLRSLPTGERVSAAMSDDAEIRRAVIHAPAPLSGVPADVKQHVYNAELQHVHGERLAAMEKAETAYLAAEAALQLASDDLARMAGAK